ncbi:unnamed protein product [Clonostachys chloroleuca]|uniref:Uncharacterized protein n=1 Tax=Clonostachys chloroleuca TaxID=1926264 RepID=A0AA35LRA0_9HYPO|nr:unnamed protein product [Clonostachys chloroleuca]
MCVPRRPRKRLRNEEPISEPQSPEFPSLGNAKPNLNPGPHVPIQMESVAAVHTPDPDAFPYFAKFAASDTFIEDEWIKDLELMHHYTSSAYLTLPRATDIRRVWQTDVASLAMSNKFLMHQLLAFSAHHLAYLNPSPDSTYAICASIHQNKAIFGLQSTLGQISNENCHAVFAASAFLCICGFASYSSLNVGDGRPAFENFLDVLLLIRGKSFILDSFAKTLHHGPLGMLFHKGDQNPAAPPILTTFVSQLRYLDSLIAEGDTNSALCREAINSTIEWTERVIESTHWPDLRFTLSWPICLSEGFVGLLKQSDPMALAILAHYGVILQHTGNMHWYLSGWGERVIKDIGDRMDTEWRETIKWPLRMVSHMG